MPELITSICIKEEFQVGDWDHLSTIQAAKLQAPITIRGRETDVRSAIGKQKF